MWFYRKILKIPWTVGVSHKKVLKRIAAKKINTQNQGKSADITCINNEEGEHGKLDSPGAY